MLEFSILGPLEARMDGQVLPVPRGKARAVLAVLLLHRNQPVSAERLIDELWGEAAPPSAAATLQVHVSQLRKALGPTAPLHTHGRAYLLDAPPGAVDVDRLEQLLAEAAQATPRRASTLLREALALWRGPALADVELEGPTRGEAERLNDLRLAALEDRIEADLALGRARDLVPELEGLVAEHPVREGLRAQLMLALYRAGRQADALDEYRRAREHLVAELGIEPGPTLRELERRILAQDPALQAAAADERHVLLPARATTLVGRDDELERAIALVRRDDVRLVTFTGPGGIGKTSLAIEAARSLAAEHADGVVFVALATVADPELVAPAVAAALGVATAPDETAEDALARFLTPRELLLVVDNVEQVLGGAPVFARLLESAPLLKLLATSREVLRIAGEHEFHLSPLSPGAAAELFLARAHAVDPTFGDADASAIAELCLRLDGVPLAIELAAARARLLSPRDMLERLASRLELLTGGRRDAPARQQTLRAAIDWSHDLLGEEERALFARLGVFSGGFDLAAVEAVCGSGVGSTEPPGSGGAGFAGAGAGNGLDLLESLVEKSLVAHAAGRFSLLEMLREYALERASALEIGPELRERHARYYHDLVHKPLDVSEQEWFARIDADYANVREALVWAVGQRSVDVALSIVVDCLLYWHLRGHLREGRRWCERVLAVTGDERSSLRMRAVNAAGIIAGEQGDLEDARRMFVEAGELASELGDEVYATVTYANLANIVLYEGGVEEARRMFVAVNDTWERLGETARLAVVRQNLGSVAFLRREWAEAERFYADAGEVARSANLSHDVASALRGRARALVMLGELDLAEQLLHESVAVSRELAEGHPLAACLDILASLAAARGDAGRAAAVLGLADALREQVGAPQAPDVRDWYEELVAGVRAQLGDAAFDAGRAAGRELSVDAALVAPVRAA